MKQHLSLLFVGHISLAFLIVYFISAKFQGIRRTVSITLVMFLSILPDIDIIFRLAGLELGHRTVTHSAIMWLAIAGVIILIFQMKYQKGPEAAVYLIAYLSHLLIGDILIGPINIVYPIGEFVINSSIDGVEYFLLEGAVFTLMVAVVISKYYSFKKRNQATFLFDYHSKMDSFLYPVLIVASVVSFFYVLAKFNLNLSEVSIVVPLHFAAVSILMLMWRASKSTVTQKELVSNP